MGAKCVAQSQKIRYFVGIPPPNFQKNIVIFHMYNCTFQIFVNFRQIDLYFFSNKRFFAKNHFVYFDQTIKDFTEVKIVTK